MGQPRRRHTEHHVHQQTPGSMPDAGSRTGLTKKNQLKKAIAVKLDIGIVSVYRV
jgi:hypothetical protein